MHRLIPVLAAAALSGAALAQPATPEQRAGVTPQPNFGTLHLQARLGSFRLIDGQGRVNMTFRGTVLVSNLRPGGRIIPGPGVVKEHESADKTRQVFHGTGSIVVIGQWRAVQWFGGDMRAVWYGAGLARITGEFDSNLDPGFYWYDDPSDKRFWFPNSAVTVTLPGFVQGRTGVTPIRRKRAS